MLNKTEKEFSPWPRAKTVLDKILASLLETKYDKTKRDEMKHDEMESDETKQDTKKRDEKWRKETANHITPLVTWPITSDFIGQ